MLVAFKNCKWMISVTANALAAWWPVCGEILEPTFLVIILSLLFKCSMCRSTGIFFPFLPLVMMVWLHFNLDTCLGESNSVYATARLIPSIPLVMMVWLHFNLDTCLGESNSIYDTARLIPSIPGALLTSKVESIVNTSVVASYIPRYHVVNVHN